MKKIVLNFEWMSSFHFNTRTRRHNAFLFKSTHTTNKSKLPHSSTHLLNAFPCQWFFALGTDYDDRRQYATGAGQLPTRHTIYIPAFVTFEVLTNILLLHTPHLTSPSKCPFFLTSYHERSVSRKSEVKDSLFEIVCKERNMKARNE